MSFDQNALQLIQSQSTAALPPITDYSRFKVSAVSTVSFSSIFSTISVCSCPSGTTNLVTTVSTGIPSTPIVSTSISIAEEKPAIKKKFQLKKPEVGILIDIDFSIKSKSSISKMASGLSFGGFNCPKFTGQPMKTFPGFWKNSIPSQPACVQMTT